MRAKMKFTAVGDMLVQRRLPDNYQGFEQIVTEIEKGEMRFFNLETTIHDHESFASQFNGGSYLCANKGVLEDAKRFGFNITSFANNHTLDYSYGGLEKTLHHLNEAGLPAAGVGMDLHSASQPVYLDCQSGRVALISVVTTFNPAAMAGHASVAIKGRPGVNGIRRKTKYYIRADQAQMIKDIAKTTQINAFIELGQREGYVPPLEEGQFQLDNLVFEISDEPGSKTILNQKDMERVKNAIFEAQLQADYIVVSIHCHEQPGDKKNEVPPFLEEMARTYIDFGAHSIVGHGPHVLRGVEIYNQRPIFYSLGDFVIHNENATKAPADFYEQYGLPSDATMHELYKKRSNGFTRGLQTKREAFETVIPYWEMEDGKLTKLTLMAVELGFGLPRSRNGLPRPATDSTILENLQELSTKYGTEFLIENNRATILL